MWSDNETTEDFLNFTGVAAAAAEVIALSGEQPVTLGISGGWGVGKSSMMKLLKAELVKKSKASDGQAAYVFVDFNAWRYQGYDDARAALVETVAKTLEGEESVKSKAANKITNILKRVNWLRAARMVFAPALASVFGLPAPGLFGAGIEIFNQLRLGQGTAKTMNDADKTVQDVADSSSDLIKADNDLSPQKEIQTIRKSFEEALDLAKVKLVVLIDDLDRCLPETAIATLEAIRLLLFMPRTAFVIAADEEMIKHAVRQHFEGVNEELVGSYYDKLVQVPIRVPPLGIQESRAYLILLFVENSSLPIQTKIDLRQQVAEQLRNGWKGSRVDRAFMESISKDLPPALISRFDLADQIAPLMTTKTGMRGNPRLIKRFLNALSIRMSLAMAQGISVDESVLVKLLLFERSASPDLYETLCSEVAKDEEGKPRFLAQFEEQAINGDDTKLEAAWNKPTLREWLQVPPRLADIDLRGALYVSRDRSPLMYPVDSLSSDGAEILNALLQNPEEAELLSDRLARLQHTDITLIMSRLIERANREEEWGTPPILTACLNVIKAESAQGMKLQTFLSNRPHKQIKPDIVPLIRSEDWAKPVLDGWRDASDISSPVKKAISRPI